MIMTFIKFFAFAWKVYVAKFTYNYTMHVLLIKTNFVTIAILLWQHDDVLFYGLPIIIMHNNYS